MKTKFFSILILLSQMAWAGEVALTIDDAPVGNQAIYSGLKRTERIISVLKKYNIQTVLFSNSRQLPFDNGLERMNSYSKAGFLIGNHTHSHFGLDKTTDVKTYLQDIDKADELLKGFPTFKKWFRYPFMQEGTTYRKRNSVREHLRKSGYKNAYVTVDLFDYFVNDLIQPALIKKQKVDLDKACVMISDLALDGLKYYDDLARQHLGGSVKQVLLLHENDIEAYCLEKLILRLKESKWAIISPEQAYSETILQDEPDTLYLGGGRIAAYLHVKTKKMFSNPWENIQILDKEFKRRKIIN